tara:strand:+ start:120 stop:2000 length:1881 start_codon:yes stop_codon:yes gene_type:complete
MSYIKPIPLEKLPYTPVELGEMLENNEQEREIEVEGYGKGRLVISRQNKNKPFFYADEANTAADQKAVKQTEALFTAANAPLLLSPLLGLASGIPKIAKDRTRAQIKKARMSADESNLDGAINLKQNIDGVFNMPSDKFQRIRNVLKKNPGMSYKDASDYVDLVQKGTVPTKPIKPGNITGVTNKGLVEGDLPLNVIHARLMKGAKDKGAGDMKMIDLGLPAFGQVSKKESVLEYRNRHFNAAQFEKDENGNYIYDDRKVIKNLKGEPRRLTTQLAQTKPGQTVKRSFENTREKTKYPFIEELGGYMKLTGSKPNLHHRFAPQVTAPLYRYLSLDDKPGTEWMQLTEFLNSRGIYPGSPVSDPSSLGGPKSNLTQLVTKGVNQRVVLPDGTEKLIHRPPEPHDILHHQYYKEKGLQDVDEGKSSWFDKRMYKITGSFEGRMQVAEELADIVNEGDRIIDESMKQIRALFGNKVKPDYIVKLLTELAETGKLKITGTKLRLKSVEKIVDIIKEEVKANLPLADEKEIINTVEQYNLDYDQEIEAIDLLHNIADYNESMRIRGKRPPSITHSQHKANIERYMNLIQTKLPLEPTTQKAKKEGLRTYTYKRVKPIPIDKQLEIIFSDDR